MKAAVIALVSLLAVSSAFAGNGAKGRLRPSRGIEGVAATDHKCFRGRPFVTLRLDSGKLLGVLTEKGFWSQKYEARRAFGPFDLAPQRDALVSYDSVPRGGGNIAETTVLAVHDLRVLVRRDVTSSRLQLFRRVSIDGTANEALMPWRRNFARVVAKETHLTEPALFAGYIRHHMPHEILYPSIRTDQDLLSPAAFLDGPAHVTWQRDYDIATAVISDMTTSHTGHALIGVDMQLDQAIAIDGYIFEATEIKNPQ